MKINSFSCCIHDYQISCHLLLPTVASVLPVQSGQHCLEFVFNENEILRRIDFTEFVVFVSRKEES